MKRVLVYTACYNEAGNIERLIEEITANAPQAEILVVDDHSPDGTGAILERLKQTRSHLHVIHRPRKLGLGTAHRLAMRYAILNNYDALITMDADFSHSPGYLPEMLEYLKEYDFCIGSRYCKGGKSAYTGMRLIISKVANFIARFVVGLPTHECTTSYRGFRTSLLKRMDLDRIRSSGYSFFVESMVEVVRCQASIKEFPIHFQDRDKGVSKISPREIRKAVFKMFSLGFRRLNVFASKVPQPPEPHVPAGCPNCAGSCYSVHLKARGGVQDMNPAAFKCSSMGHRTHGTIAECLQCGLIYALPSLSRSQLFESYANVEDQEYLKNAPARERTFRHNFAKVRGLLPANGKLLEVGAYYGLFLRHAQTLGYQASGIEPSHHAVNHAKQQGLRHIAQGDLSTIAEREGTLDAVVMWDVLEHLPDPLKELRHAHRLLKPGGVFVFSTIVVDAWWPRFMGKRWPWYMDMHLLYFTRPVLDDMLSKAGFEPVAEYPYRHYASVPYLLMKLRGLGLWGAGAASKLLGLIGLSRLCVPISLGDVRMFAYRAVAPAEPQAAGLRERPCASAKTA